MRARLPGASRTALWGVLVLLALSMLAASGMMYLLHSPQGNQRLSAFLSEKIGTAFAGRIEIGQVEDLKLDSIIARSVRFYPPNDRTPAIDVPRVVMSFSPWEMLNGEYGWSRAEIEKPIVRVTEDADGKINMEKLFAKPKKSKDEPSSSDDGARVDMRMMMTKGATLHIGGGSLPKLDLHEVDGVMRIEIEPDGATTLRFDEYRGRLDGLPVGALDFRNVKGQVWTTGKHLLHFEGAGTHKDEPVAFGLDIATKPSQVHIDATYDEVSKASLATRLFSIWTKVKPGIDVDVHLR